MLYTLAQISLFAAFLTFIFGRYGHITSISNSWYQLPGRENWMFSAFLFLLGSLNMFHGDIFFFLSGAGLFFTAATPRYKDQHQTRVHGAGAISSIVFGFAGLLSKFGWAEFLTAIPFAIIAGVVTFDKGRNHVYWSEVLCFAGIMAGLVVGYW